MKKLNSLLLLVFAAVVAFSFCGCSDDDDEGGVDKNVLTSCMWVLEKQVDSDNDLNSTYSGTEGGWLNFYTDGTGEIVYGTKGKQDEIMEWGANGNGSHSFAYTISGNSILIVSDDSANSTHKWQVVSISKTTMVLRWTDEDYSITCTFKAYE